jgi:hypothetical protein
VTTLQLSRSFDPDFLPDPKMKSFDLVVACWNLMRETPIVWVPEHIKGHQDTDFTLGVLSRQACLNVAMDKAAKTSVLDPCNVKVTRYAIPNRERNI